MPKDSKDQKRETFRLTISLKTATDAEKASLSKQGMPGYVYRIRPYRLDETVRRFGVQRENMQPKTISKATQQAHARAIFKGEEPFVACVSSELNDARAKLFAAYAMLRWMKHAGASPAAWHAPNGSAASDRMLMDADSTLKKHPSRLVIANADSKMSYRKREKLRDLLEAYSDIPRLVTATGAHPVEMMNSVGFHCHYCVWIRAADSWGA